MIASQDVVRLTSSMFTLIGHLLVLFQVAIDLFRDAEPGGSSKVLWIVGPVFVPVLTAPIHVAGRGRGMAEGWRAAVRQATSSTGADIGAATGRSPASGIAEARAVLDAGTIAQDGLARLKAKALA